MTTLTIQCFLLAWAIATGPVATYEITTNGELFAVVPARPGTEDMTHEVCLPERNTPYEFHIAAVDADGNVSEPSEPSVIQFEQSCDWNADGQCSLFDLFGYAKQLGTCYTAVRQIPCP